MIMEMPAFAARYGQAMPEVDFPWGGQWRPV